MKKFFKLVDGKKLYCDEAGVLTQKDGANVEVPATDTEAVDVESGTDEATKMLSEAMQKAMEAGDKIAVAKLKAAQDAVSDMLDSVAATAKVKTVVAEVAENKASFDAAEVLKSAQALKKSPGNVVFKFNDAKELQSFTRSTDRTDLTGDVILPDRDTKISRTPQRTTYVEDIANTVTTDSDTVEWVEVVTETGAPATTAELAVIPEKDFTFQTQRQAVEKIGVINKHSIELLKHAPELVAAIQRMLNVDMRIATDAQLLSGNGVTPNLQGVLGVATVLNAAAIGTQRVANANLFDVLRIAGTKIASAGKGQYNPNFVVLNPVDTEKFDLTKNADGDYIMPPFYDAAGRLVRGARVIENTGITADTFLMGDFNYLHVRPNGGTEVAFSNSDGTDFQKGILTVRMLRYLAAYVKNNDSGAFQTGSISGVIAALIAP